MLRDLHDGTWFRLDGGYLIETRLGSRQGCKFGAIISNLMYCRALDDLRYEGVLSVFEYYPEAAPTCGVIMQKVFTSHFLELNRKPLKTECILHLVGCGTKRAWTTIERSAEQRASAGPGAAKHACRTPGGFECNIVPCYKHVGSMIDGTGGLECELHARIAAANRVYQPLAKKLMSAKYLNCKTKVQLFRSLVLSVLLYWV